jgi:hypothetical protein
MMIGKKIAWTAWALLPVTALAYHFGPGQRAYVEDRANVVLRQAKLLESQADERQGRAYELHLASLKARQVAHASKAAEDVALAKEKAEQEDLAYKEAGQAWKSTADKLQEAQSMLAGCGSKRASEIRVARGRALIRAGEIEQGVDDLEQMLEDLDVQGLETSALSHLVREEVATGYYYGARLLRADGKPTSEWREVSGWARQNFRYLAEASESAADPRAEELQKNLELVLNLEQSAQEDLLAKPLPKYSPRSNCDGLANGKNKRKGKKPPRSKKDARGAGGADDVTGGW